MTYRTLLMSSLVAICLSASVQAADMMQDMTDHKPGSMSSPAMQALRRSPDLDAMTAAVVPKFTQQTYTDAVTGKTISYNLYLPKDYDPAKSYPLVLYIGDASTAAKDVTAPLTEGGYGGIIWASDAEQAKHEAIVVVPQYPQVILDDHGQHVMSDYVELTGRFLVDVAQRYHADPSRIYGTGQSMGCMTVMYLAANHPDLFAATLLVDGQWDIHQLQGLKSQKFIYVAAGGDDKAYAGLTEVKDMLDDAKLPYGYAADLDAKGNSFLREAIASVVLDKGYGQNFFTWKTGSVLPENAPADASEHMFSFNHAYEMKAFRDWLFAQHK